MSLGAGRFARFLITGGIAALVNLVSRYVFDVFIDYGWAVLLACPCAMTTAWILSRRFVFEPSGLTPQEEYIRFGLVNLVAAAQVYAVSVGLAEHGFPAIGFAWHPYDVAHLIGVVVPVFTSYFGHKYFSFRKITGAADPASKTGPATAAGRGPPFSGLGN